eukprot:c45549_g1_i1.p1 GENE.c45549_g1_i1~~c45549_g1_i1.p1  ORF type:complete len:426 (+),score=47.35 c45549_g1_i1:253-1530(+)
MGCGASVATGSPAAAPEPVETRSRSHSSNHSNSGFPPGALRSSSRARTSVFGESVVPSNHASENTAPKVVHAKSETAKSKIRAALSRVCLFQGLRDELLEDVVNAMFEREIPRNTTVIRFGESGDFMYIVAKGAFDVFVAGKLVATCGVGGSFGELALMYGSPRAATVKSAEDSVCFLLDRVTFKSSVVSSADRVRKMYIDFLRRSPVFSALTPEELAAIADSLSPVKFLDGEVIFRQGDRADRFYMIERGTASVRQTKDRGEVQVGFLRSGDYFGEMALVNTSTRAASVIAEGNCYCVTMDRDAFNRQLGPCEAVMRRRMLAYPKYEDVLSAAVQLDDDEETGLSRALNNSARMRDLSGVALDVPERSVTIIPAESSTSSPTGSRRSSGSSSSSSSSSSRDAAVASTSGKGGASPRASARAVAR